MMQSPSGRTRPLPWPANPWKRMQVLRRAAVSTFSRNCSVKTKFREGQSVLRRCLGCAISRRKRDA